MEEKTPNQFGSELGASPITPSAIGQIRQLSIPLWARILALLLATVTLIGGGLLVWQGWSACTAACNEKWLENGTKIVGAAFVPVVVLVYLVFAETGVAALIRKTTELLRRTIPNALRNADFDHGFDVVGELERCEIDTVHPADTPRARYRISALRASKKAQMDFIVDLNVSKANVVFFIPATESIGSGDLTQLRSRFRATMEGAEHEGYVFDQAMHEVRIADRRYVKFVARRRLPENFLWDPARKLHFAQDLRMFVHSMILDGWDIFAAE